MRRIIICLYKFILSLHFHFRRTQLKMSNAFPIFQVKKLINDGTVYVNKYILLKAFLDQLSASNFHRNC